MSLIEEMRTAIKLAKALDHCIDVDAVERWADRLERSGAIVPVPDGEVCDTGEIIVGSIGLSQRNYNWRDGVGYNDGLGVKSIIDHDWMDISEDETAQPVRLVPIAEAQIDG